METVVGTSTVVANPILPGPESPLDTIKAQLEVEPATLAEPQEIVFWPDETLRAKSTPCIRFGSDIKPLFETLKNVIRGHGVGISAIQIGVPYRAIVVTGNNGELICAANPKIIEASDEKVGIKEGCLSFPGLFMVVYRPDEVTVSYQNEEGETRTVVASGMEARIWQHEIDHLDGVVFLDRVPEFRRKETLAKWKKLRFRANKSSKFR